MRDHHSPHREHGDGRDGFEKRPGRERGGRGPRVFAPGDLKLLLLALIAEQPCHGYDLIRQIEGMFDGAYSPSPGVIYPTLTFLEESEMIQGDAEGGKTLRRHRCRASVLERAGDCPGRCADAHRCQQTLAARS